MMSALAPDPWTGRLELVVTVSDTGAIRDRSGRKKCAKRATCHPAEPADARVGGSTGGTVVIHSSLWFVVTFTQAGVERWVDDALARDQLLRPFRRWFRSALPGGYSPLAPSRSMLLFSKGTGLPSHAHHFRTQVSSRTLQRTSNLLIRICWRVRGWSCRAFNGATPRIETRCVRYRARSTRISWAGRPTGWQRFPGGRSCAVGETVRCRSPLQLRAYLHRSFAGAALLCR